MSLSSQHHTFDIALAAKYGVERAILIHHFQHWIRFNRIRKTNLKENKCWSYQTRAEIAAHFPYMTEDSVRHHLEVLIHGSEEMGIEPVLLAKNLNKNRMNKTLWYAFVDEEKFGVSEDQIQKMFTKGENPTSSGENPTSSGENPKCNKDKILKEDAEKNIQKGSKKSRKSKKPKDPPSAKALELVEYFLSRIRELKPDFIQPNVEKWAYSFDEMIVKDNRDPQKIKEVIDWIKKGTAGFAFISSPSTLKERFDAQEMRMDADKKTKEQKNIAKRVNNNRNYSLYIYKQYPKQYYGLCIDSEKVINTKNGSALFFDSEEEEFRRDLDKLFGGTNG